MKYIIFVIACFVSTSAFAQTIDCDAAAPAQPGSVTSARPYTVAFCVPSTITVNNPDGTTDTVPTRIDGYVAQLDANAPVDLPKATVAVGTPSSSQKLVPTSFRSTSGTTKGSHTITVTLWNCPLDGQGVPMTSCTTAQRQMGPAVAIPFVASDPVAPGPPPAIQKGRVIR